MNHDSRSPSGRRDLRLVATPPVESEQLSDLIEAVVLLHREVSEPLGLLRGASTPVAPITSIQEALTSIDSLIKAACQIRRLRPVSSV